MLPAAASSTASPRRPTRWRLALFIAAALSFPGVQANAQDGNDEREPLADGPPEYRHAHALLASGDTLGAMDQLQNVVESNREHGQAWLELGNLLVERAGEVETDFQLRNEAERALTRAFDLLGPAPDVMLAFGLLYRKRHMQTDAVRVLERATAGAESDEHHFTPEERARTHEALARVYETWWEDWHRLVNVPPTASGNLSCSRGGGDVHTAATFCPGRWWHVVPRLVPIEEMKYPERDLMLENYRLALDYNANQVSAGISLLGHLADADRWAEYLDIAERLVESAREDPRAHLFLGIGLHERSRVAEAREAFENGIALLDPAARAVFGDVAILLDEDLRNRYEQAGGAMRAEISRVFFAGKDPVYLTETNERQLEHWARVAWAELKFSEPASGRRGWDSERGQIWIRYGRPAVRLQCCYVDRGEKVVGRWDIWSFGPAGPNFAFQRSLTYRRATHSEESKFLADDLAARQPTSYDAAAITSVHGYPHQLARFRGERPGLTRVEVYSAPPVDSLLRRDGDDSLLLHESEDSLPGFAALETGLFVFDSAMRPLWSARDTLHAGSEGYPRLTYRFTVPAGSYEYALEARRVGSDSLPRPLARERPTVETSGFPAGVLAVSDLLLADTLTGSTRTAKDREDLRLVPRRSLTLTPGEPIRLYFEIYGLDADENNLAHYRAKLAITSAEDESVVMRALRGLTQLFGDSDDPTVVLWERTAEISDARVVDYLTVDAGVLEVGAYTVRLTIENLATGETTERERRFVVAAEE